VAGDVSHAGAASKEHQAGPGHGSMDAMTIATWILAIATLALAVEGGTALLQWTNRLRPGRTSRELAAMHREITLLQHAAWMDVANAGQGTRPEVDEKVRAMLMLDGWTPDMHLAEQAGYFDIHRLHGGIPGITNT
jgi:hypothetical protein